MKIFSWIQNKRNGKDSYSSRKLHLVSSANCYVQEEFCREEAIDWHNPLLGIGTIGNINLKEAMTEKASPSSPSDNSQDPTPQEVGKFQKELSLSLQDRIGPHSIVASEAEEKTSNDAHSDDPNNKDGTLQGNNTLGFSRGKDICFDKTKKAIGEKPLSFLLKKMIACRSGFGPTPSLKDPLSESRMEKIMISILHKKIYPQSSSATLSTKKYLKNNVHAPKSANDDDVNEKKGDGSKWVKTDSEYIVLEI